MRHSRIASLPTSTLRTLEEFINETFFDEDDVNELVALGDFSAKM